MKLRTILLLAALLLGAGAAAEARCWPCAHRSHAARSAFMRQSGYPHGRPGYRIDHVVPLACGGKDAPGNMQWQTIAEAKAKDKWERRGCRGGPRK